MTMITKSIVIGVCILLAICVTGFLIEYISIKVQKRKNPSQRWDPVTPFKARPEDVDKALKADLVGTVYKDGFSMGADLSRGPDFSDLPPKSEVGLEKKKHIDHVDALVGAAQIIRQNPEPVPVKITGSGIGYGLSLFPEPVKIYYVSSGQYWRRYRDKNMRFISKDLADKLEDAWCKKDCQCLVMDGTIYQIHIKSL